MSTDAPIVRPAGETDLAPMAAMAADLVRFHHALDDRRFFLAREPVAVPCLDAARELTQPNAILLVAQLEAEIVGYCYGRLEARDWNMLLDRHAALHDVFVLEAARKHRAGELLVSAFLDHARDRGAPRVVLHTATQNHAAQALFAKLGFRATMLEMTREL